MQQPTITLDGITYDIWTITWHEGEITHLAIEHGDDNTRTIFNSEFSVDNDGIWSVPNLEQYINDPSKLNSDNPQKEGEL